MNDCATTVFEDCVSIIPTDICIRLVRGTDSTFDFILTDGVNEPINITNDIVRISVRNFKKGVLKIQKENGVGQHLDPTNGKTRFVFIPTDFPGTQIDDHDYWVYEVRRIQPAGEENVYITGQFIVDLAVGGAP